MVVLEDVVASNERVPNELPPDLVAVFVGGTSGVGEYTLKAWARYTRNPRIYIVGRSQSAADRIITECQQLNSIGTFEFIKADISLISGVDEVCRQLRRKESAINLLFETQGTMGFAKETAERLPLSSALTMHSRIRFIRNLLPLLQQATCLRRVVSVLSATCEGAVDVNNLYGKDLPLMKWRDQSASMHTLLLEELARRAPTVSFVHTVPGVVPSGISRDAEGFGLRMMLMVSKLFAPFIETSPSECGERHVFLASSARYSRSQNSDGATGVVVNPEVGMARGSDGVVGSGVCTVDNKGECATKTVEELLFKLRRDGTAQKVWEFVATDCKRITGTDVAA